MKSNHMKELIINFSHIICGFYFTLFALMRLGLVRLYALHQPNSYLGIRFVRRFVNRIFGLGYRIHTAVFVCRAKQNHALIGVEKAAKQSTETEQEDETQNAKNNTNAQSERSKQNILFDIYDFCVLHTCSWFDLKISCISSLITRFHIVQRCLV